VIKFIALLTRRVGMSIPDFQAYWRDVHGPLITRAPGLRRYIQSHSIIEAYDSYPQAYDGMAEVWFDDLEAYRVGQATWDEAGKDLPNFVDRVVSLLASEVPIVDALPSARDRTAMVKYAGFLTRKAGLSLEAMQKHWREVHGPLVATELTGMRRYVQCHTLPEAYALQPPPAYDGVPEAWFDSLEAVPRRLGRQDGPPTTEANVDSFTIFEQPIPSILAREVVIVDAG
jgi:uncharacterized protein (TIGR02118 family)